MEEFPTVNPTVDTRKYGPRLATDRETSLHHRSIIDYHLRSIDLSTGYSVLTFSPICRHVESIGRSLPFAPLYGTTNMENGICVVIVSRMTLGINFWRAYGM